MSEEVEKRKFKVADNRRFDTAGNERDATFEEVERVLADNGDKTSATKQAVMEEKKVVANKEHPEEVDEHTEGITFSSFVISLATQALIQMGQMEAPEGAGIPKDLQAAKQTIDLIAVLDEKTKGNLDVNEAQLMEQILHSLRLSYVNAVAR